MKYNNINLKFDIFELNNAEKFEKEANKVAVVAEKSKSEISVSKIIKMQCKAIFDFFDSLFGNGVHKKLFGSRVNLVQAVTVYKEFSEYVLSQKNVLEKLGGEK